MSEHLPECHYVEDTGNVRYGWNDCICDELREHLLECSWAPHECDEDMCERCDRGCYCNELRACEQRVAGETQAAMMEFFRMKPSPPHDQHYFADNICAYCVGRSDAFTAAREAVAALPEYKMRDTCVSAIDEFREEMK